MQVDETQIEKFVRYPHTLSQKELDDVQQLIESNELARELAEFYRSFYSELDLINRPSKVILNYYKPEITLKPSFILAADSKKEVKKSLITKATFSSEESGTLVRILEDNSDESFQIHVLSRLVTKDERILIQFDNPPIDLVTEKGGVLKNIMNDSFNVADWSRTTLILSLPKSTCSYSPHSGEFTVCENCTLTVERGHLWLQTTESDFKKVLLEQENKTQLFTVEDKKVPIEADLTKPLILYLYS